MNMRQQHVLLLMVRAQRLDELVAASQSPDLLEAWRFVARARNNVVHGDYISDTNLSAAARMAARLTEVGEKALVKGATMDNVTYVRWRRGEPREGRVVPGGGDNTAPCISCTQPLGDGRPLQLLAIGPDMKGGDGESAERCAAGHWFSALALIMHAECLGVEPVAT